MTLTYCTCYSRHGFESLTAKRPMPHHAFAGIYFASGVAGFTVLYCRKERGILFLKLEQSFLKNLFRLKQSAVDSEGCINALEFNALTLSKRFFICTVHHTVMLKKINFRYAFLKF